MNRPIPRPRGGGHLTPPVPASHFAAHPDEVLRELQHTLEELQIAEEEVRQQNDSLAEANAALEAQRRRYEELFDLAPDAYLVTDSQEVVREANRAAEELFGVDSHFLVGKPLRVFVPPGCGADFDAALRLLYDTGTVRGREIEVQGRGGRPIPVAVFAGTSYRAGRPATLLWMLHDLSALKEAQRQQVPVERLAAMGQAVGAVAHEGRTLLQRSLACLRILALDLADRPEALALVGRAQKAQEELQRLFEDVRVFANPAALRLVPCDVAAVWREAWSQLEPAREGRSCVLREDGAGDGLKCFADPLKLTIVFRNLLDNALAASPDPAEIVLSTAPAELDGRPALAVAVRDNGPGISPEQMPKLFEPFYTTKARGTGLGLAVSRQIIEAQGGTIAAGNAPGGGAEFRVVLPCPEENS